MSTKIHVPVLYGYCRISTYKQKISRQVDNIKRVYPSAVILQEIFNGNTNDRPVFKKLINKVKRGDTICFDEVSRMSRNAIEGYKLYIDLYNKGINLVFLKEPYINTDVYRDTLNKKIDTTGEEITDIVIQATNEIFSILAQRQIQVAFEMAQSEINYIQRRTSEGVRKAQIEGKTIGRSPGSKIITKKSVVAKEQIMKHSKYFGGSLKDIELIKMLGISRSTYYKYKKEIKLHE